MSIDPTERMRAEIMARGLVEKSYEQDRGAQYDTEGLLRHFEVIAYAAPFVVVRRRSDDQMGSLMFAHQPRVYFGWMADGEEE